jgi:hypothetical protein
VNRLPALLAVLLVVAVGAGVIVYVSLDNGASAFTARGHTVAQSTIDDELGALAGNAAFVRVVRQSRSAPVAPNPGSVDAGYASGWVTLRIAQTFVDDAVARRHLHVGAADRAAGEAIGTQLLGSAQVLRTLPSWFSVELRDRLARMAALERSIVANPTARLRDAALSQCPSRRYVAHILVATLAEAQTLKRQLDAGASFADLARQHSTDTASAVRGGALGCLDAQQFVAPFQQAASSQPIGQVSDPVQTQFGFHLILVTNQPPASELARVALVEVLGLAQGQPVTVDPRYGVWDRRNGRVIPPFAARAAATTG